MKILIHVQHLLGIGHARRAALIARALAESGLDVTVAAGGFPVPGIDYAPARTVQLPPARSADSGFRVVLDEAGQPIDAGWKSRRTDALLKTFADVGPDALIVETFPFGRRKFRFELAPLLDLATRTRPRPLIASSVRDILVAKTDPGKVAEMAAMARRWFDLVLVHGDPALIRFEASFPLADRIADLIRYTGYVSPPRATAAAPDGVGAVIVSVGGGAVGEALLRAAVAARPETVLADVPWRLLAGPDLPRPVFDDLRRMAPAGVVVEPARPDFAGLLARCRLSISQAGYNTVIDVLAAGCPAVLVPFAAGGETEQRDRAALLAARGLAQVVDEATLSPASLAAAVDAAIRLPRRATAIRLDGAETTARMVLEAARRDR